MAIVSLSLSQAGVLDAFPDINSVPALRSIVRDPVIEALRNTIAFDHIAVSGLDIPSFELGNGRSFDTDLKPLLVDTYFAEKLNLSDPLLIAARASTGPVLEQDAYDRFPVPNRLLELATAFEIKNRVLVPVSRDDFVYGGVCYSRQVPFTQAELDYLAFISGPLHTRFTKPLLDRFAAQTLALTSGELICLRLASRGLTSDQIGIESGYQLRTVDTYIKSATKKLGAVNRVHAVSEALRRRLFV